MLSSFLPKHAHQRGVRRAQEPEPGINSCQNHCLCAGHLSSCFPSTPVAKRPAPKPGSRRHPSHSDLAKERQRGKAVKEGRAERGNPWLFNKLGSASTSGSRCSRMGTRLLLTLFCTATSPLVLTPPGHRPLSCRGVHLVSPRNSISTSRVMLWAGLSH